MFDLTDEPAITVIISPCAVQEPVRFSYGLQTKNPGTGAEGATLFLSFLTTPARLAGNSSYVDLRGKATVIWHDAPNPENAKIWAMGLRGYEPRETIVDGSDVQASTPVISPLDFAFGE